MIYDALSVFCVNTVLLMGIILFFVRTAGHKNSHHSMARNLLVISCVLMAIGFISLWIYPKPFGYFCFPILFFTLIEQLLFTFTLLALLGSDKVSLRRMVVYLSPILLFFITYILILFFYGYTKVETLSMMFSTLDKPIMIIRLLFFILYGIEMGLLMGLFVQQYEKSIQTNIQKRYRLSKLKTRYIIFSVWNFCFMLQIFNLPPLYTNFMMVVTGCFFGWGILDFLNEFSHSFVDYDFMKEEEKILVTNRSLEITEEDKTTLLISAQIDQWIDNKMYTKVGIVLADIAQELHVSQKKLSLYISKKYQLNFNTWINTLRIEEAKRLMHQNRKLSITELSELVGFSDRSHFSRQFKQITGETAITYHQRLKSDSEKYLQEV